MWCWCITADHGEVEPDGGLYLLTHDSKRGKPKDTALPGQKLRDVLSGYPCPVLLILDACHSGKFPLGGRPPTRSAACWRMTAAASP